MKELSAAAKGRFEAYLRDVSSSLAGCVTIDPVEVSGDVKMHILSALEDLPEPVSLDDLEGVLGALGQPTQWVPEEDISSWPRFAALYRERPHDVRLGGLAFLMFVFSSLSIPISLWASVLLLIFACAISRVTLSMIEARDDEAGILKWLLYPPLALGYLLVITLIVGAGPVLGLMGLYN